MYTELFPLLTTMCVRAYSHLGSNPISLTEIREVSWQSGDYYVAYVPTGGPHTLHTHTQTPASQRSAPENETATVRIYRMIAVNQCYNPKSCIYSVFSGSYFEKNHLHLMASISDCCGSSSTDRLTPFHVANPSFDGLRKKRTALSFQ